MSRRKSRLMSCIIGYALLILGSSVILIPFLWMISTALKNNVDTFAIPPIWIPRPAQWGNFERLFALVPFNLYLRNSAVVTLLSIIGVVISSSLTAFAFARLDAPGRNLWFTLVLSTMMLPDFVTIIPTFVLFRYLGWLDTYLPVIVPKFFGVGAAFSIFLLRQFMMTIPKSMDEAAMIDGCSYFRIYLHIIMPLCRPALLTVSLLAFMFYWNDYFGPLIFINSMDKYTLPLGLSTFQTAYTTDWALLMAGTLLSMIPCIALFLAAQKYYVRGIAVSDILKG